MTFEDYVIEELLQQDNIEYLELDDTSIVYYDVDYTTQDWLFPLPNFNHDQICNAFPAWYC